MDTNLLQKLKEWRLAMAKREGVPVFRILSNEVLEAIAQSQPRDKEGLLLIKGIRDKKYNTYGKAILALVTSDQKNLDFPKNDFIEANTPLSVSDYLDFLNDQLFQCTARIQGEISSVDIRERVLYFTLKDSTDGSVISCLVWKNVYELSGIEFKIGLEIIVSGAPDIFKPNGRLSFKVLSAELVGEGALKMAYDTLKKKLETEGLFLVENKREIPELPQKIGLITSKTSAAIGDFKMNLGQFGFHVSFIDSRVEGQLAVSELVSAIRAFRHTDIEVLVLVRGGGSLESLLPFNNEILVREIVDFPVPVLVGVGHERDVSLAGLAADKMVSTPTAAAQTLNVSWQNVTSHILHQQHILYSLFERVLGDRRTLLTESFYAIRDHFQSIFDNFNRAERRLVHVFTSSKFQVAELHRVLSEYPHILKREMKGIVERTNVHVSTVLVAPMHQINFALKFAQQHGTWDGTVRVYERALEGTKKDVYVIEKTLGSHNPERQLKLGYSIVRSSGGVIRSVGQIKKGQSVEVRLQDGSFTTHVTGITKRV